jgi:hypothetical protein
MRRGILIVVGAVALALLLGGAAFVGVRMLDASARGGSDAGGAGRVMEIVSNDGSGPVSLRIRVEPAPELPDRPAEASGVFAGRQDSRILVGTGAIELDVEVNGDTGERTVNLSHRGPEVEVVVVHDTLIYRDETEMPLGGLGADKSGEHTIQQVIVPVDSLEELGKNTELQVWGELRGGRVVAEVLVYRIVKEW